MAKRTTHPTASFLRGSSVNLSPALATHASGRASAAILDATGRVQTHSLTFPRGSLTVLPKENIFLTAGADASRCQPRFHTWETRKGSTPAGQPVGSVTQDSPAEHTPTAWTGCLQSSGGSAPLAAFQPETTRRNLSLSGSKPFKQ